MQRTNPTQAKAQRGDAALVLRRVTEKFFNS